MTMMRLTTIAIATTMLLSALPTSNGTESEVQPVDVAVGDEEIDEELLDFLAETNNGLGKTKMRGCKSCSISCLLSSCQTIGCCLNYANCYCDLVQSARCDCG